MHNNDSSRNDVFHVGGDEPDPTGTGLRGVSAGHDLTRAALGHPFLLYQLRGAAVLLEADVYADDAGEPDYIYINCPACLANGRTVQLRIRRSQKQFSYENAAPPTFSGWDRSAMRAAIAQAMNVHPDRMPLNWGGTLSVEPFRCTFEQTAEPGQMFSFSRCPWSVSIENNVIKDQR